MTFPYLQYWMFVAGNMLAGMGILAIIQAFPRAFRAYVGAPGRDAPPAGGEDRPAPDRRAGAGRHASCGPNGRGASLKRRDRSEFESRQLDTRDQLDVLADGYEAGRDTGDLPAVRTDAAAYAGSGERLGSIRIPGYAQYQPSYAQNGADLGMGSHPLDGITFNDATDPEIDEDPYGEVLGGVDL